MRLLDILAAGEVGAGARHLEYPVVGAGGKSQLVESGLQQGFRVGSEPAHLADDIRGYPAVAPDGGPGEPRFLDIHRLLHALGDRRGAFLWDTPAEVLVFHRLDLYLYIYPVEDRLRDTVEVRRDLLRSAGALLHGAAEIAAGAGIHRRHQHYVAGVADGTACPGYRDIPVFQRLPEGFQHPAVELRKLVQEQHAVVRKAYLPRAGNASAAEETVARCQAEGVDAFAVQADVSDEDAVKSLVKSARERFGRIDVLINNAGITRDNLMLRMSAEDFDLVIEKNLRGAFLMTKYVGKEMLHQRSGRIVNISSVVGVHGNAGQANYAASKAGLIGLTKTTALEYASRGITANAIAPGFIDTDMTKVLPEKVKEAMLQQIPLRQFGSPEDVAKAAAFLASDDARYITGQVLGVDGGMGC